MEIIEKIYKTRECTRNAIKKYTIKNSALLNAKNLELYHKNMQDPIYVEKRREYDRNRKQIKALSKKDTLNNPISLGEKTI